MDADAARKERRETLWGTGLAVLLCGLLACALAWSPPTSEDEFAGAPWVMLACAVGVGVGVHWFTWAWSLPTDGSVWPAHRRGINPVWLLAMFPVLLVLFADSTNEKAQWVLPLAWAWFFGDKLAGVVLGHVTRGRSLAAEGGSRQLVRRPLRK